MESVICVVYGDLRIVHIVWHTMPIGMMEYIHACLEVFLPSFDAFAFLYFDCMARSDHQILNSEVWNGIPKVMDRSTRYDHLRTEKVWETIHSRYKECFH